MRRPRKVKMIKTVLFILAVLSLTVSDHVKAAALYCWGWNEYGQLGTGDTASASVPTEATAVTSASITPTQVALGQRHTCVLADNGTVWCWGYNYYGQLGDGTTEDRLTPVQVVGLTNVIKISSGGLASCALKDDGTVWCWGYNNQGQLGDGTTFNRSTPVQVVGLSDVVDISSSGPHTCAVKNDGTVYCWGYNNHGQLGDGTIFTQRTPVQVVGLSGAIQVTAGIYHTCALKNDGTVWCWGDNTYGQVGDGSASDQHTPVQVPGLADIVGLSGGALHTCAVKNDGTVWCWGYNSSGQLGDGTTLNRPTPVQVVGLNNAVEITTGFCHVCARTGDNSVYCWGCNSYNQMGDGSNVSSSFATRVDLSFTSSLWARSKESYHSCAIAEPPVLSVSPTSLTFTRPEESQTVTVTTTATITGIVSSDPSVFGIGNDSCTGNSSDCTFDVVFRPRALIDYSGTITVNYSGGSETISVEANLSDEARAPVACTAGGAPTEFRTANKAFLIVIRKGSCVRR